MVGNKKKNQGNKMVASLQKQLRMVEAGVVKVACPADPPPYAIRPWQKCTITLPSGSVSASTIAKALANSIGLIEAAATFDAWDLIDIRLMDLKIYGDTSPTAAEQNVELLVYETRVVNGANAGTPFSRTALELLDRSARNKRARLGVQFRLPALNGNNTSTIFSFVGVLAQLTVQWRITSDNWLIVP